SLTHSLIALLLAVILPASLTIIVSPQKGFCNNAEVELFQCSVKDTSSEYNTREFVIYAPVSNDPGIDTGFTNEVSSNTLSCLPNVRVEEKWKGHNLLLILGILKKDATYKIWVIVRDGEVAEALKAEYRAEGLTTEIMGYEISCKKWLPGNK
ncbi:MAG: hypothetical protein NTW04_01540, partial [Elusimicrobia bacterium]|nr:hypothetical protein [Elusimicrobiota bacterium]